MATQLNVIQDEKAKGKSATKAQEAADELTYYMTFNQSVTQAMARTMQDLLDFVFIYMANITLLRCDSYLEFLRQGVEYDSSSFEDISTLCSQIVLSQKCRRKLVLMKSDSLGGPHKKSDRCHPYSRQNEHRKLVRKPDHQPGNKFA